MSFVESGASVTVGGVGSKIGGRRQVATAGWGTSARGSPKQMGGAVPTYNFCWNGRWRLRQQRQSCGGGSPALSCFACSMRRISARETKVLSPPQPIRARALRPPPGRTPAHSAEVLVPRRKKQSQPALCIQAPWDLRQHHPTQTNQSSIRHLNQKPSHTTTTTP